MSSNRQAKTQRRAMIVGTLAMGLGLAIPQANGAEKKKNDKHPKIHKAIQELKDAKEYLERAPHAFGGHRAKAVKLIGDTIDELRVCLNY